MNQIAGTKDPEDEPVAQSQTQLQPELQEASKGSDKSELASGEEEAVGEEKPAGDPMEEDPVSSATVFCIKLKQPRSNLQHKMSVPELCRNFRYVQWKIARVLAQFCVFVGGYFLDCDIVFLWFFVLC